MVTVLVVTSTILLVAFVWVAFRAEHWRSRTRSLLAICEVQEAELKFLRRRVGTQRATIAEQFAANVMTIRDQLKG